MFDPHLHLLIDDDEIAYRRDLTRFVEQPQRLALEPVLKPERPWEGRGVSVWGSIYLEDDIYRMWYLGSGGGRGRYATSVCYATSPDGVNWTRGEFDHVSHPTGTPNNLVFRDEGEPEATHTHPFSVLIDPLDPDPERRHKLIAYFVTVTRERGYMLSTSADGIHWGAAQRVLLPRGDRTSVLQDFKRGGFIMATRGDNRGRDRQAGHAPKRDIAVSRSDDLLTWTPTTRVFEADDDDPAGTEFYGMPMFCWGNQYVGLLEPYDKPNEILNVQLATSRDGDHWQRACSRRTYFDVGASDAWDSSWVAFAMSPPVVRGDEMLFWYAGRPTAHRRLGDRPLTSSIGIARAPRDRFAGLRAGPDGGELTTDWIEVGGPRLLLNIGAANGPVSVAITGDDATAIDGYGHADCDADISGGVDVPVTWRGKDLSALVGQRVRLHLTITYATVYAYRFTSA